VLAEEFMTGPEVSVESFTVDDVTHIVTITDKMVTELPYFVETGHTEPSRLPEAAQRDIRGVTLAAVSALHLHNGPTHTEIKVTPDGAKLVEIAARLGGDFITSKLVPLSSGVDLIDCSLSSVLGEPVRWERTLSRGAAIRYIQAPEGRIVSVEGTAEAESIPGVCEVVMYRKAGELAPQLRSSGDRLGHVIACAEDADAAERTCNAALACIKVHTEKPCDAPERGV
jgi:biotin carboxylase